MRGLACALPPDTAWRGCLQSEELDDHWVDFLAVVKNMEAGARLRYPTPHESLEEFRIESGAPVHVHLRVHEPPRSTVMLHVNLHGLHKPQTAFTDMR